MGQSTPRGRSLALLAALLGWLFDGMEMGLFPLVARSALAELLGPGSAEAGQQSWFAVVTAAFLIGAATGGVLFGWLGDKLGRVRAMTLSVLLYSLSSGLAALSDAPWQLAGLRFVGALGMGGEWALGVALVMEVWPNANRAVLAGLIGAAGNLGYVLCGAIAYGLNHLGGRVGDTLLVLGVPPETTAALTANGFWRLLMVVGTLPAVLTLGIRLFVPESDKWERESGSAGNWGAADLLGVLGGAAAAGGLVYLWAAPFPPAVRVAGTVGGLGLVTVGYLLPARQYLLRSGLPTAVRRHVLGRMLLAAGLSGVPLLGTWAGVMWQYQWVGKLPGGDHPDARAVTQIWSATGAAVGCFLAAVLAGRFGRRPTYAVLCAASGATIFGFYNLNAAYDWPFLLSAGLMGLVAASFYGWLPLYLPELFPTTVRATGQGFGFNFGRILAAVGNLLMPGLLTAFGNDYAKACAVVPLVYLAGLVFVAVAPETRGKPLPD
jgi:MFS family permease